MQTLVHLWFSLFYRNLTTLPFCSALVRGFQFDSEVSVLTIQSHRQTQFYSGQEAAAISGRNPINSSPQTFLSDLVPVETFYPSHKQQI